MDNIILENQGDMPENWITDTVLIRDENGQIIELKAPDIEEE